MLCSQEICRTFHSLASSHTSSSDDDLKGSTLLTSLMSCFFSLCQSFLSTDSLLKEKFSSLLTDSANIPGNHFWYTLQDLANKLSPQKKSWSLKSTSPLQVLSLCWRVLSTFYLCSLYLSFFLLIILNEERGRQPLWEMHESTALSETFTSITFSLIPLPIEINRLIRRKDCGHAGRRDPGDMHLLFLTHVSFSWKCVWLMQIHSPSYRVDRMPS